MTELAEPAGVSCQDQQAKVPLAIVPRLYRPSGLLCELVEDARLDHEAHCTGKPRGPQTGFPALDARLNGALRPGLHIVHGGPGTGKTAWALQVAACCGTPALFVSCEISLHEIMRRLMARVTETYLHRLKTGELSADEVLSLARLACDETPQLALADGTAAYPSVDWLIEQAADVRGDNRHLLIVVDSLHTWANRAQYRLPEYEMLNTALADLERLAGTLKAPVLVIAERNRASMGGGGLNAAKGSSRIEYAGETLMGLNAECDEKTGRPVPLDVYNERGVELWIEKNRHGDHGVKVALRFNGPCQRFREE